MAKEILEVGTKAPSFSAQTQAGEMVSLSDFSGQKVVLYFYPKDDTPGCTKQACNLRDHQTVLQDAGIAVLGVSPDDVASHVKFTDKFSLNFPLLADPEKVICKEYGVWGPKNLYGRLFDGLKRTTFLIDESGMIVKVFRRPKTATHTEEILAAWEKIAPKN